MCLSVILKEGSQGMTFEFRFWCHFYNHQPRPRDHLGSRTGVSPRVKIRRAVDFLSVLSRLFRAPVKYEKTVERTLASFFVL